MKLWATFFELRKRKDGSPYYAEACGDRSVIRLDGRCRMTTHHDNARQWAIKHGFDGYRIERGDNLLNLFALTASVQPVERP